MATTNPDLDTGRIKEWRSIVALIVFVITNLLVLFPVKVPIPFPVSWYHYVWDTSSRLRIIPPRRDSPNTCNGDMLGRDRDKTARFIMVLHFPLNFITAPLIADLFLLAILAIGRTEVHDGTVGANHIHPIDIMVFFLTLAYIAISIDASGLIRWLAFKVLQKGGKKGHLLFLYLYLFFFALATFTGNDPVVLGGTPFLAYMTKAARNISTPKAWIFAQFAMANVGSAILVSSNPTNLVLAGAFSIKFIDYTANVIVPVVVTAIVMFPFMLYVLFRDGELVPRRIELHELPPELQGQAPMNPNVKPHITADEITDEAQTEFKTLQEIMNPYLDKKSAFFGTAMMAVTLITILALNAALHQGGEIPVYWVTLPAAVLVFCWDVVRDWLRREQNWALAKSAEQEAAEVQLEAIGPHGANFDMHGRAVSEESRVQIAELPDFKKPRLGGRTPSKEGAIATASDETGVLRIKSSVDSKQPASQPSFAPSSTTKARQHTPTTLASLLDSLCHKACSTFPTATGILTHLPFPLIPFALAMFVLVQALVTKGWVLVFAHRWQHWIDRTGTIGAIGGMAFLSVVLCNFAGTNIGTAILLCRVVQTWVEISASHQDGGGAIQQRTFWATVYALTLGLNFGAFSTVFSASLAGLLWRGILARKGVVVGAREFAKVNLPIVVLGTIVGCAVLAGEVYIFRDTAPYMSGN